MLRIFAIGLLLAGVATAGGGVAAQTIARDEAVRSAQTQAEMLAADVVQPAVLNGLVDGSPAAVAALDRRVRTSVLRPGIARVKVWNTGSTIVYSDDSRLTGRTFELDPVERQAMVDGTAHAEVADLQDSDNLYDHGLGPVLEVYQGIRAPDGRPLLFEVYFQYGQVVAAADAVWTGFALVTGVGVLLIVGGLLPFVNRMVRTLERDQQQREALLKKALDAADAERRRIVAAVHDGPVQELVGASYQLGAAAAGHAGTEAVTVLEIAEIEVRAAIESIRATLVDIYPPALVDSGLGAALSGLAASARSRGAYVAVQVADGLALAPAAQQLVFRIARETIANGVKHALGTVLHVTLFDDGPDVVLTVQDDGPGFDAAAAITCPPEGHFGLRTLQDAVTDSGVGAELALRTAPGAGTTWRLTLLGAAQHRTTDQPAQRLSEPFSPAVGGVG